MLSPWANRHSHVMDNQIGVGVLQKRVMMTNTIQAFQLPQISVRGRLVRMDDMLDQIIAQHEYPDWVGFQLAETLLLNAAMAAALKLQGKLSLQVQSEGAIKLIATDYFAGKDGAAATMRGYVRFDQEAKDAGEPLFRKGIFGIILDQGAGMQPYQGMTQLAESLTQSASEYFAQSEQIPTVFHIDVVRDALNEKWHGGLIMAQQVADEGGIEAAKLDPADLTTMEALLNTVEREELFAGEISGEELLYRLFHEFEPRAHPAEAVQFGCQCSEDKVRQSLSIYSQKDLTHMTTDDGKITADCQFCGQHYELKPETVGFEAE